MKGDPAMLVIKTDFTGLSKIHSHAVNKKETQ